MTTDQELINELKKINQKLDYFTSPLHHSFYHLRAGIFHSIGNLLGTIVVAALAFYFLSQINLNQIITQWLQGLTQQIIPPSFRL